MNRPDLKIRMTDDAGYVPAYAHETDAGIDLCAVCDYDINPGDSTLVRTGLCIELPDGCFGLETPRSGLGSRGITMRNAVGIIDPGYRGELKCALWNTTSETIHVKRHERICQLVIVPFVHANIVLADELSDTDRGKAGYGSTGLGMLPADEKLPPIKDSAAVDPENMQ